MHANLVGITAVVLAVLGFRWAHQWSGKRSAGVRWLWLTLLSLASVPGLLMGIYYFHVLPERAWFYEFRSWWGSELLVIPIGVLGGMASALLPRIVLPIALLLSVGAAALPFVKPIAAPLGDEAFHERWEQSVCFQSTASTCGPASLASVLKSFGLTVSEKEVARECYSYAGGTEAWYLARFARAHGLVVGFDFKPLPVTEFDPPGIAGVKLGGAGHFIPILEREGTQVTIADPLQGLRSMPVDELTKRYRFTGFFMTIRRR